MLYGVNKDLSVTSRHELFLLENWGLLILTFCCCSGLAKNVSKVLYVFKQIVPQFVPQISGSNNFVTGSRIDFYYNFS
jgi:hypothetical protein